MNRWHLQKPGTKGVRMSSGITQYTSWCGITIYALMPEQLVTCKRCLGAAHKYRMTHLQEKPNA